MKNELQKHLIPLLTIFIFLSIFWIFASVPYYNFIFLFLGLSLGAFFLDIDHLIYWLYLNPNIEESRLAQIAIKKYDFSSILKLLDYTHHQHTNLIFHHYFFQVVLTLLSVFVFTSSANIFTMAFLLALHVHILVDEISDYNRDKLHLQEWLFARENKQLPAKYLSRYIAVFVFITLIFILLLLKSIS